MDGQDSVLDFYRQPAAMSSPGAHATLYTALPDEVDRLAAVVQGVLLHEHWAGAYGQTLSDERRAGSHIRQTARMLDWLGRDAPPLQARALEDRLIGTCRDFTLLTVSMLRAKGVPARGRCGFGAYFERGQYVDHWVCEYWRADDARWAMADAQIDAVQSKALNPDFDLMDVPRDRFLIAGDAWAQCRAGALDAQNFGIMDMRGLWFIAGNVIRDFAALNNTEMLPWDVWGPMPQPGEPLTPDQVSLFDRLAGLTQSPDANFSEIRALYDSEESLRPPPVVFNAVRNRPESVDG
ncbi:MAG: transglutaminase domain-containing protein [Caulobacterales bacterium]